MAILKDFYDVHKIIAKYPNADTYVIFGKRSNGKSYSVLDYGLEQYGTFGKSFVYVRRFDEEIAPKWTEQLYTHHFRNGRVDKWIKNEKWNGVEVKKSRITLTATSWNKGKRSIIRAEQPLAYMLSLNTWQHSKGITLPDIGFIMFDEFLTRDWYLPDEVNTWQNLMSSIVRSNGDIKIFMLANTVNVSSPYFTEMGLYHISEMKPGSTALYTTADGKGQFAVEYTGAKGGGDDSDKFFSVYDNPASRMITTGEWETSVYPRCPYDLDKCRLITSVYFMYLREVVKCSVYIYEDRAFLYIVQSNGSRYFQDADMREIKPMYKNMIIYSDVPLTNHVYRFAITKQSDDLSKLIVKLLREGYTFYANNRAGETLRNYLKWSQTWSPIL